jgi:hypothetical protein
MAISTADGYIAALKQRVLLDKLASRTVVAAIPFSVFDLAGNPGSGALAGTSTTVGVVPTDATAGCPDIQFSSGVGYLSKVEFGNTVASRLHIFDKLWHGGPYLFGTDVPTITPGSIAARCPDYPGSGTVFGAGNEIWVEVSTAFVTGTAWQIQVGYTNSQGTAGRLTVISAAQAAAALTLGKMFQLALQSGDCGVQSIQSVDVTNGGTAMTAGQVSVLIMRPLWTNGRVPLANGGDVHDMFKTGLPIVYYNSALYLVVQADSTASGLPELVLEIASA